MAFQMKMVTMSTLFGEVKFSGGSSLKEEAEAATEFLKNNLEFFELKTIQEVTGSASSSPEEALKGRKMTLAKMSLKWEESWEESDLKPKEQENHRRNLAILRRLFKSHSVELTPQQADRVLEVAENMPRGNMKPYKDMPLEERIDLAIAGRVPREHRVAHARPALKTFQGLYSWLSSQYLVDSKPFNDRRYTLRRKGERGAFTREEMQRIVDYSASQTEPCRKWMPLLMAYSGMRNNEIEGLVRDDVRRCQSSGLLYIQISDSKTKASTRRVPIAEELLRLGFRDFIDSASSGRLFPVKEKWLTRYYDSVLKRECGLDDVDGKGNSLTLYSMRHTVTSLIRGNGANEALSMALMGHSKGRTVHDGYTHVDLIELEKLKELVDSLPYSSTRH